MPFTNLAVLPGIAVRAGTVVLIRLCVHTCPSVLTGSVGPTVVQICTQGMGVTNSCFKRGFQRQNEVIVLFFVTFWGGIAFLLLCLVLSYHTCERKSQDYII